MWLSREGMDWVRGSHKYTHTRTQTNTERAPLRHATTIWFDSPCCCLDLPYFNRWWLHTVKSKLSQACNAGINKGIFWGPFAARIRQWLWPRSCPNVSKLENQFFFLCLHFVPPSVFDHYEDTVQVDFFFNCAIFLDVIWALSMCPKTLPAQPDVHPW